MPSTAKRKKRTNAGAIVVFSRVSRSLHKMLLKDARERDVPISVLVRERLERIYGMSA